MHPKTNTPVTPARSLIDVSHVPKGRDHAMLLKACRHVSGLGGDLKANDLAAIDLWIEVGFSERVTLSAKRGLPQSRAAWVALYESDGPGAPCPAGDPQRSPLLFVDLRIVSAQQLSSLGLSFLLNLVRRTERKCQFVFDSWRQSECSRIDFHASARALRQPLAAR